MTKKVIYVSGKYTAGKTKKQTVSENIDKARKVSIKLWNKGFAVLTPHLNTAGFETEKSITATYDDFIAGDLAFIDGMDALFMLDNWKESKGAVIEHEYAFKKGVPIFYSIRGINNLKKVKICDICNKTRQLINTVVGYTLCVECNKKFDVIHNGIEKEESKMFLKIVRL